MGLAARWFRRRGQEKHQRRDAKNEVKLCAQKEKKVKIFKTHHTMPPKLFPGSGATIATASAKDKEVSLDNRASSNISEKQLSMGDQNKLLMDKRAS